MKNLYILGVTGSIGQQTLDVVRQHPNKYCVKAISANKNIELVKKIVNEFKPMYVSMGTKELANEIRDNFSVVTGYHEQGLMQVATFNPSDKDGILVNAVVGSVGLKPTVAAIELGRDIAIANKETLVVAGEIVTRLAKENNVKLLPVDSEHSAIFQCLNGEKKESVNKIIITASGGSFRDKTREELKTVTLEETLQHPNWSMGSKITIDSATMMNKGLEVIEAHYLFDIPYEKIETILHKESVIHSMVEYNDTSVIAQLGNPDMRIPIQYALSYPDRLYATQESLDLKMYKSLHFEELSFDRYPCLKMAYQAGKDSGLMPCVMNAANEASVNLFLQKKISFLMIEEIIEKCMKKFSNKICPDLDDIIRMDKQVKDYVYNKYKK